MQTIVATAIPRITDEFQVSLPALPGTTVHGRKNGLLTARAALAQSVPDIGWYAASFFITLAVFQAPWGKAYKHFDLKFTFLTTVFLFELGSLICGVLSGNASLPCPSLLLQTPD